MQGMLLEERKSESAEAFGKKAGYLSSYIIFTTAVFYVRNFMGAPDSWSYINAAGIAGAVAVLGIILRRLLK